MGALDGQRYLSGISHCLGPSFLAPYITPPSERGRFDRRVKHACSPVRCPRSRQVRPRVAGPWALAPLPLPQHADPLSIAPGTFSGVGSHTGGGCHSQQQQQSQEQQSAAWPGSGGTRRLWDAHIAGAATGWSARRKAGWGSAGQWLQGRCEPVLSLLSMQSGSLGEG